MKREWILNIATNRWGLNKKSSVGPVSKWIRECSPKDIKEWESFYFKKLKEFLKNNKKIDIDPKEYLILLGKKLYIKITEVLRAEIDEITEEDCINYIKELVINKTYEGYITEKQTIYGQLQKLLNVEIKPAPDEWDRLYNVDFFIEVNGKYIGLQIKPITFEHAPEFSRKWKEIYSKSHEKFTKKFGGKVFIIFSIKEKGKKKIYNIEILEEIKKEIARLKNKVYTL